LCAPRSTEKIGPDTTGAFIMAEEKLTAETVRKLAAEIGMTTLNDAQLQELTRATEASRARRKLLAVQTLTYADEPSHVYGLTAGDAR
jgi:hypothetical protein